MVVNKIVDHSLFVSQLELSGLSFLLVLFALSYKKIIDKERN